MSSTRSFRRLVFFQLVRRVAKNNPLSCRCRRVCLIECDSVLGRRTLSLSKPLLGRETLSRSNRGLSISNASLVFSFSRAPNARSRTHLAQRSMSPGVSALGSSERERGSDSTPTTRISAPAAIAPVSTPARERAGRVGRDRSCRFEMERNGTPAGRCGDGAARRTGAYN